MDTPLDPSGAAPTGLGPDDVSDQPSVIEPEVRSRLPYIIGLAVFIVAAGVAFVALGSDEPPNAVGFADIEFTLADGSTASLADFDGEPLVVNFFASWCAPCISEMPDLERVHLDTQDRVQFLGIAVPPGLDDIPSLVAETGVTYPWGSDADSALLEHFDATGMPTTVFIRADGTIAERHLGALDAAGISELVDRIG